MTRGGPAGAAVKRAFVLLGHARRLPGKFDLPFGGRTILGQVLEAVRGAGLHAAIVSVGPGPPVDVPVLRDDLDLGPLGGLAVAQRATREPFFLLGGDMPRVDPRALASLRRAFDGRTLVPLSDRHRPQVLHAIYANVDPGLVRSLLDRGRGLTDLVRTMAGRGEVKLLPPGAVDPRSFVDIDTAREYVRRRNESERDVGGRSGRPVRRVPHPGHRPGINRRSP